jgi:alpha-L-fucosidase 2
MIAIVKSFHTRTVVRIQWIPGALLCAGLLMGAVVGAEPVVIWDNRPAEQWDTAYPVGNGRLGAMPWGLYPQEKVLINEESIWNRRGGFGMPQDSFEHLEEVRRLEAAGDYRGADQHFERHLQNGLDPCGYQLVGWVQWTYLDTAPLKETRRALDLATGVATSDHLLTDGTRIQQRVLASAPGDVILVRLSATQPIGVRISVDGGRVEDNDLVLTGAASGNNATRFVGRARVLPADKATPAGDALEVRDSREITLLLSVATNFDRQNSQAMLPEGWQAKAVLDLDRLRERSPAEIEEAAVRDHQQFFGRVAVDFGATAAEVQALATRERLQRIQKGHTDDPDLIETYFQFGRYLLIASSRPGTFPANLQGVWNPHPSAPWGSDFHLNINIQMNYWPAESTHLAEMHEPLFDLIRYLQPNGKEMARRLGMQGWCMGHATDLWGHAQLMSRTAYWGGSFFGGQWMTLHILEHYRFNRDREFLRRQWDVLTASVEFALSWLIPGPEAGQLMCRPSCSPENSFLYEDAAGKEVRAALSAGGTFDQFMVLQVFADYLEAAEALGRSKDPLVQRVRATLPKVYRPRVAEDGRLMEWRLPFNESEPGHRHISHVIGAYPGNPINLDRDPAMREAVMRSIEGRLAKGGAGTGWSRAWTIGMFARLAEPGRAYENLIAILQRSTLDNLWDNHPPFQIDGNFGATAAIAEMLLHSHNDEIRLLPALPDQWSAGYARGLRARGDFTVDIQWQGGELTAATVRAGPNAVAGTVPIRYGQRRAEFGIEPGKILEVRLGDLKEPIQADQRAALESMTHSGAKHTVIKIGFALSQEAEQSAGGMIVADVDNDHKMDYLITAPGRLAVFGNDGRELWRKSVDIGVGGQSESEGLPGHHGPGVAAADVDGDGRTEVVFLTKDSVLHIVDGATGEQKGRAKPPIPSGAARWELAMIATFQKEENRDILLQATNEKGYRMGRFLAAYRIADLLAGREPLWTTDKFVSCAHNGARLADVDGDGLDEVLGATILSPTGRLLVEAAPFNGHMDSVFVADVRPETPGLEILLLEEGSNHVQLLGLGGLLWRVHHMRQEPQNATLGRFKAGSDEIFIWCRSRYDQHQKPFVFDSKGDLACHYEMDSVAPADWTKSGVEVIHRIDWTGERQQLACAKERHKRGDVCVFEPLTGKFVERFRTQADRLYVADVSGDWREEILVISGDELHIYENTAANPRPDEPRLWKDRNYGRLKQYHNYYSP